MKISYSLCAIYYTSSAVWSINLHQVTVLISLCLCTCMRLLHNTDEQECVGPAHNSSRFWPRAGGGENPSLLAEGVSGQRCRAEASHRAWYLLERTEVETVQHTPRPASRGGGQNRMYAGPELLVFHLCLSPVLVAQNAQFVTNEERLGNVCFVFEMLAGKESQHARLMCERRGKSP